MSTSLTYRAALARLQQTVAGYAKNHRAKIGVKFPAGSPEADDTTRKAEANEELVSYIDTVMATDVDYEHSCMVTNLQKSGEAILAKLTPLQAATLHMAVGVAGEGGELLDAVKRWTIYQKDLDLDNVIEELGDIEFFLEGIRQNLAITREQTLEANLNKLLKGDRARYKDGYSDAAAIRRDDKTETDPHAKMAAAVQAKIDAAKAGENKA